KLEASKDLLEAITEVAPGKDGGFDAKRFGHWLARMDGRVADGLKLIKHQERDRHRGKPQWFVAPSLHPLHPSAAFFHSTRGRNGSQNRWEERQEWSQKGAKGANAHSSLDASPEPFGDPELDDLIESL